MSQAGQGQTVIDMAVQHLGLAEAAWALAERNGVGLIDSVSGLDLDMPNVDIDSDTVAAMAGSSPATDGEPRRGTRTPIGELIIGKDRI
ncbi:MAG: hypothetical protein IJ684_03045 [Bacteroidales bacterium]|nr:hypothetical protein [Bacteroidales bacterium]